MNTTINSNNENNDLDIKFLFNIFKREKLLILSVTSIFLVFSFIYIFLKKKIWQGEFQIVLGGQYTQNIEKPNEIVNSIISANSGTPELKTEVAILKSPSVLMPVYEFVLGEKQREFKNFKYLSFNDWEKQINIGLETGTKVLNIKYRDKNKDFIIPVLEKISNTYQIYSGKAKKRAAELNREYLTEQIALYKEKSSNSLKIAEQFAMDQDLTILDFGLKEYIPSKMKSNPNFNIIGDQSFLEDSSVMSNLDIESIRVKAANELRNINLQLNKISQFDNDSVQIQYLSLILPESLQEGLPEKLEEIDFRLASLKTQFKENDPLFKKVSLNREILINQLKERTVGYLEAIKIKVESTMEAASRPKGVIIKYKELVREAARDENTLINLEDKLRLFNLNQSKKEDPWELITQPTLEFFPVEPNKPRIIIIGLLIGIIFAYLAAFYKENTSDIIFENDFLENKFKVKIIEKINITDESFKINSNVILRDEILMFNSDKNISFIGTGKIERNQSKKLFEIIFGKQNEFFIENDFNKLDNKNKNILIIKNLRETKREIEILKNRLDLCGKKIFGIIVLEE